MNKIIKKIKNTSKVELIDLINNIINNSMEYNI